MKSIYFIEDLARKKRARLQPIRTLSEIKATIVIEPTKRRALYQIISQKVKQLRLLGMSYESIAKSLNIDKATARKACRYIPINHRESLIEEG